MDRLYNALARDVELESSHFGDLRVENKKLKKIALKFPTP